MKKSLCTLKRVLKISALTLLPIWSQARGEGYCNVLYWPNKNMGFGHTAFEVFMPGNDGEAPNIYISWANCNRKKLDMRNHKRDPKIVRLGGISMENFAKFKAWFEASPYKYPHCQYALTYDLLKNNCAHSVAHGLEALGFGVKSNRLALRPHEVYRHAKKINAAKS